MPQKAPYETVIGLEVHAQLLTRTKMFCSDSTDFGREPNTQVSAVSLGHPGTLPLMNREAMMLAIRLGLACHCSITRHHYFDRKNYFYPDLPKGYQITQHSAPVCSNGFLDITTSEGIKRIRINRIHLEEDAGKSMHGNDSLTRIDYNRAGMPLVEIVTEPDIRTGEEAAQFVSSLRMLVRHLGVCDGNMEQGSLRCDVNISVRPSGEAKPGTKVEIKNLNSIRFIRKAIAFEEKRMAGMLDRQEKIVQQTRGLDESDFSTFAIRTKEDEDDYRYFPEPDIPLFQVSDEMIATIRSKMPPLPEEIHAKLTGTFGLSEYDAGRISIDLGLTSIFMESAHYCQQYKLLANWIIGPVRQYLSAQATEEPATVNPQSLAEMITMIGEGTISHGLAMNEVFPMICTDPQLDVKAFVTEKGLALAQPEEAIDEMIAAALLKHAQKIPEYKKGKKGLVQVFVGEVMRAARGKADASLVTKKIIEKLNEVS